MKHDPKSQLCCVYGLRLCLDDYFELLQILQTDGFQINVTTDEYQLDEPNEIKELKQPFVHDLRVTSRPTSNEGLFLGSSHLAVTVTGSTANIHFYNFPDVQYSRALHVIDLLRSKRSAWRIANAWIFDSFWGVVSLVTPLALLEITQRAWQLSKRQDLWFTLAALLIVLLLLATGLIRRSAKWQRKQAAVYLSERLQTAGFLARHKDALERLLIAVVAAVAGALAKSLF